MQFIQQMVDLQNQKIDGDGCNSCFVMLVALGLFGWIFHTLGRVIFNTLQDAWIFFHRPDAFVRTIEFFGVYVVALGMCLGVAIVLIIIVRLIPEAWMYRLIGWETSDEDDYYN
jgi:hypothetical protein